MNRRSLQILVLVLAITLVLVGAVGGVLAWLTDVSTPVVNTFVPGKIDIDLDETATDFKMIPGYTIEKDPIVTITDDSEDCFVFVVVTESSNLNDYIDYAMADGWTKLDTTFGVKDGDTVYYRTVAKTATERSFSVFKDNQVTVRTSVTSADMTEAETNKPTLTFTAFAIQQDSSNNTPFTAENAWKALNPA